MIKKFIRFSKLCPSEHQGLLFKWFHSKKKVFIKVDSLLTMITNSFKIPFIQKLENIFFIFHSFFAQKFIFLFWKYQQNLEMTKTFETKVYLFHANADIKIIFTSFNKVHSKMKNIHKQKQKERP